MPVKKYQLYSFQKTFNSFMPVEPKNAQTISMFSLLPGHFSETIWRRNVGHNPTHNSLQINSKVIFKSTIIPEDNISGGSPGMNGSTVKYFLINTEYKLKRYNIILKLITLILWFLFISIGSNLPLFKHVHGRWYT